MERTAFGLVFLVSAAVILAGVAPLAKAEGPQLDRRSSSPVKGGAAMGGERQGDGPPSPLALRSTVEDGYRVEEGFLRTNIKGRLVLLEGLVVKKADAVGKLPIMIITHGTNSSARERQQMTPRGTKDGDLRLLRAYAQRGWLAVYALR